MKKLILSQSIARKVASLFLVLGVSLTGVTVLPETASAYHKTNKWEIRKNIEDGWIVIYSKELSHTEELKLSAAIATDVLVSKGGATSLYFGEFAQDSIDQVISQARAKAPQIADSLRRELTPEKLLSAIKASFDGNRVELSLSGITLQIGRATYNRAECAKVPLLGEACTATPNTYQPYIRFKVAQTQPTRSAPQAQPISSTVKPNPRPTPEPSYYTKRLGEHCQWFLNNQGRTDWWGLIQTSAQGDAGNTDSEYYRKRIADHCEWFLNNQGRTDWWNLIESSARGDAGLPLVGQ